MEQKIYELTACLDGAFETVSTLNNIADTSTEGTADLILPSRDGVEGKYTKDPFSVGELVIYRGQEYQVDHVGTLKTNPSSQESLTETFFGFVGEPEELANPAAGIKAMVYNVKFDEKNANLILLGNQLQGFKLHSGEGESSVLNGTRLYGFGEPVVLYGLSEEGIPGTVRSARSVVLPKETFLKALEGSLEMLLDLNKGIHIKKANAPLDDKEQEEKSEPDYRTPFQPEHNFEYPYAPKQGPAAPLNNG